MRNEPGREGETSKWNRRQCGLGRGCREGAPRTGCCLCEPRRRGQRSPSKRLRSRNGVSLEGCSQGSKGGIPCNLTVRKATGERTLCSCPRCCTPRWHISVSPIGCELEDTPHCMNERSPQTHPAESRRTRRRAQFPFLQCSPSQDSVRATALVRYGGPLNGSHLAPVRMALRLRATTS